MRIKKSNISGFSIIEVMIAIFIFAMAMASIFMIITSSMNVNDLNKNQIIASNLASEQIEIIRNIRDNNYKNLSKWNYIPNPSKNYEKTFEAGKYYKIENDYSSQDYPFKINEISNFGEGKSELNGKMQNYRLYLDNKNHYTFENSGTGTIFYKYLKIDELKDNSGNIIDDSLKIKSKVIWYFKGYHEFEINTILTNFNRY